MKKLISILVAIFFSCSLVSAQDTFKPDLLFVYHLHGQTRKFDVQITKKDGGILFSWGIMRNLKYWRGEYFHTPKAVSGSRSICYEQPLNGLEMTLDDAMFAMVSSQVLKELKAGSSVIDGVTYTLVGKESQALGHDLIHVRDNREGAEMWIVDDEGMPIIWSMKNNPVEIDWDVEIKK